MPLEEEFETIDDETIEIFAELGVAIDQINSLLFDFAGSPLTDEKKQLLVVAEEKLKKAIVRGGGTWTGTGILARLAEIQKNIQ